MRPVVLSAFVAAAGMVLLAAQPADAQDRRQGARPRVIYVNPDQPRTRTRITVRRERSFLDAGTEVGPMTKSYTDYARSPLEAPWRNWDPAQSFRSPLPDTWTFPGYW